MSEPSKKSKSRQVFENIFENQTRRFSAFDLLGLSTSIEESGRSPITEAPFARDAKAEEINQVPAARVESHSHAHRPDSHTKALSHTIDLPAFSKTTEPGRANVLGTESQSHIHRTDSPAGLASREEPTTEILNESPTLEGSHTEDHRSDSLAVVLGQEKIDASVSKERLIDSRSSSDGKHELDRNSTTAQHPGHVTRENKGQEIVARPSRGGSVHLASSDGPTPVPGEERIHRPSSEGISLNEAAHGSGDEAVISRPAYQGTELLTRNDSGFSEVPNIATEGDLAVPLGPDRLVQGQTVDGLGAQTPDRLALGQTVWPYLGRTVVKKPRYKLGTDHPALEDAPSPPSMSILLAPVQWRVWQALLRMEGTNIITSYREISKITKSTLDGVRKAIRVIEREGGIIGKETIRTSDMQGFRFTLNRSIAFHQGTVNQAKAILKRGLHLAQTPDRTSLMLGPDRLRLFVCKNINIKQTDVVGLLNVTPQSWAIREQTLIQIAELLPDMTALEFRLSLTHLVEQVKSAKQPIRNHNAWVKAAFEKSGAPLVTERDIEAQFLRTDTRKVHVAHEPRANDDAQDNELRFLRLYLTCDPVDRAEIDKIAEQKTTPLLKVVAPEHQESLLLEARIEAVREYFGSKL